MASSMNFDTTTGFAGSTSVALVRYDSRVFLSKTTAMAAPERT